MKIGAPTPAVKADQGMSECIPSDAHHIRRGKLYEGVVYQPDINHISTTLSDGQQNLNAMTPESANRMLEKATYRTSNERTDDEDGLLDRMTKVAASMSLDVSPVQWRQIPRLTTATGSDGNGHAADPDDPPAYDSDCEADEPLAGGFAATMSSGSRILPPTGKTGCTCPSSPRTRRILPRCSNVRLIQGSKRSECWRILRRALPWPWKLIRGTYDPAQGEVQVVGLC